MRDEIWTTAAGQRLAVADMSEGHAKNALRQLIRRARRRAAADHIDPALRDELTQIAALSAMGCDEYGSLD